MMITLSNQSIQIQCKLIENYGSFKKARKPFNIRLFFYSKTTVVNERDGDAAQSMAIVKPEIDENGERDKLVQFEKTPDESSYAQNYLTNVSAISYVLIFQI